MTKEGQYRRATEACCASLDVSYLSGFGQLKLDLFERQFGPFGFEDGDFVVFGQLSRHIGLAIRRMMVNMEDFLWVGFQVAYI